jgi:predicted RNase H-like HicB family nuclease/DNA-binding XRE family transcriptional regulator
MNYHFKIHKEGKGFWAQCIELEGCVTQADDLNNLKINMQEALNSYVEEAENCEDLATLPDNSIKSTKYIIRVPVNPQIAFALLVRYYRTKHKMTQQEAAKKLGFPNIYSYQRLETRKCNPRLETIASLKKLFPEFSIDYVL